MLRTADTVAVPRILVICIGTQEDRDQLGWHGPLVVAPARAEDQQGVATDRAAEHADGRTAARR